MVPHLEATLYMCALVKLLPELTIPSISSVSNSCTKTFTRFF